jgi:hypothetical protein
MAASIHPDHHHPCSSMNSSMLDVDVDVDVDVEVEVEVPINDA